jgi:hypothetical protein
MLCASGDLVELRHKPRNPYDENAVAVWSERGVQLGYVCAKRALLIGKTNERRRDHRLFRRYTGTGQISVSGSEAGCLPCPTWFLMFRCPNLPGKCGQRSDRCTILTRSTRQRRT